MNDKELNDLLEEFARWLELKLFNEIDLDIPHEKGEEEKG